ncbi:MAG: metallophosphoesterase [Candidatus Thorarchaeota archaeon]
MRILLSADLHGDFSKLARLAEKVDLCICCGDVIDYHQLPTEDFSFPRPFYCVKGNKEIWGGESLQQALTKCPNFFWLNDHLDKLERRTGLRFYGIDFLHEPPMLPASVDFLISHQPAFGLADQCSDPFHAKSVEHCGSKAIRQLVDQHRPRFIVAGHVHTYQKQQLRETLGITLPSALNPPVVMIINQEICCFNGF